MRSAGVVIVAMLGAGCVTQRSLTVGQMASAVGRGGGDVNVFTGAMYQSQTAPATTSKDIAGNDVSNQVNSKGLSIPWFEANANYGFGDHLALNVHLGPAGIQPGLKITLNKSPIANIALLPQVGLGYASYSQSITVADQSGRGEETSPTATTSFIFSVGLKLLISHQSGFYVGLGYDFMYTRNSQLSTTGTNQTRVEYQTLLTSLQHQISAGVGFSVKVGMLSIRPEIGFAIAPGISGSRAAYDSQSNSTTTLSASGGFGWAFVGGFGFALTTPRTRDDKGAEEDDRNVGGSEETEEAPRERLREDDI